MADDEKKTKGKAKNESTDNSESKQESKQPQRKEESTTEHIKKEWVQPMIRETLQNIGIGILAYLGIIRGQTQAGGGPLTPGGGGPAQQKEKQTPGWMMSMFPSLTREQYNEYNIILSSVGEEPKETAKKFRNMMEEEGIYDHVQYIVNLILARREYSEKLKNPAPENKGTNQLSFEKLTLKDPVADFFNELLKEEKKNGTPEEIYERQKERAKERDFLSEKSWLSKYKLEIFLGIFLIPFGIVLLFL